MLMTKNVEIDGSLARINEENEDINKGCRESGQCWWEIKAKDIFFLGKTHGTNNFFLGDMKKEKKNTNILGLN